MESIVLNVPSHQAGAILGQGGSRVSSIRLDSGSDVRIQQSGSGVLLRRIEIRGNNSMGALKQVLAAINDNAKEDEDVSLQLLISSQYAGGVIGPQGQTIQGIRQAHPNVQLHMEKNVGHAPERVIYVTGVALEVCETILSIAAIIEDGLKDGTLIVNSPGNKRPRTLSGEHVNRNQQTFGRVARHPQGSKTEGEMILQITNEQAGKIIGKGGRQIHTIRQKCGCRIDLEQNNDGRSNQRTLRVVGPLFQIEEACRILSMYLDDY